VNYLFGMDELRSPNVPPVRTDPDDPRVGSLLGAATTPESATVVLVGFPTDAGVRRNGGRPGAADGPDALRRALWPMTPDAERYGDFIDLLGRTTDLGNLVVTGDLAADQEALGRVLAPHLRRGAVAIILGGGHETAFGHFLGHGAVGRPVHILNWDAHPDVRPLKDGRGHSGSPFRQALEHPSGVCRGYTVAGLNPPSVAQAHLEYLTEHECTAHFNTSISFTAVESIYAACEHATMVTFDLDALDQAAAPGVSAPATAGLSPHIWLHAANKAGVCSTVRSIDVVELSPPLDPDGRTARLAARTVWEFLRGLARRLSEED
jgi:formiminoglutamase